jgi:hypothetical protein
MIEFYKCFKERIKHRGGVMNVKRMKKNFLVLSTVFGMLITASMANATLMDINEIIFEGNDTNSANLSGTVDMYTHDSNYLKVIITNTSSLASDISSQNLLTGLGFNLPGLDILSGTATINGQTAINFTMPGNYDVSGEWGYDNNPISSGPFQTGSEGEAGMSSTVNTVVSSMISTTEIPFSLDSISKPDNLNGPEFGLLSGQVLQSVAGGLNAIQDTITIDLLLSGSYSGLEGFINSHDVVLSFGSPDHSTSEVPIPAAVWLLGSGFIGVVVRKKREQTV